MYKSGFKNNHSETKEDENYLFSNVVHNNLKTTKVEMMDKHINTYEGKINSSELHSIVKTIFGFDLDKMPILAKEIAEPLKEHALTGYTIPLSRIVMDTFLKKLGKDVTPENIRKIINQIFGTNLEGISSLEGAKISLFSKGQWITRNNKDLFEVHTGIGDIDVWIIPSKYLTEQTGLEELPTELKQSLDSIGYYYDEAIGSYYYSNPTGKAVPDDFKGQTIGAIKRIIQNLYAHLH